MNDGENEPITNRTARYVVAIAVGAFGIAGGVYGLDGRIQANTRDIIELSKRVDVMAEKNETLKLEQVPADLDKVKRLLCTGGDSVRQRECQILGIIE